MFRIKNLTLCFMLFGFGLVLAQEVSPPVPDFPEIPEIEFFQDLELFPEIEIIPEIEAFHEFNFFPEMDISLEGIPFAEAPLLPEDSPKPGGPPGKGEKMQEKVEALRVWKLLETLDLTEEQANSFLPAYREFQKSEENYNQNRRELLDQLQQSLESKDQKKISEIVAKLKQNRLQMEQNRVQFLTRIDKMLSPEQQAKFLLFQNRFEGRMRAEIMELRQPQIYKNLQKPYLELELKTLNDKLQMLHKKNFKEDDLEELKARLEESHQKAEEMYKRSEQMYEELMKKFNEIEKKEKSKKSY